MHFNCSITTAFYICFYYFVMVHVFLEMSFKGRTLLFLIFFFFFFFFMIIPIFVQITMQCSAKKSERKCEWLYLQGIAMHLPRYMEKLSALLCSSELLKPKEITLPWYFGFKIWLVCRIQIESMGLFVIYQAEFAAYLCSLSCTVWSIIHCPLQCLKSIKNNVRTIKTFKCMSLFDKSLKKDPQVLQVLLTLCALTLLQASSAQETRLLKGIMAFWIRSRLCAG